MLAVEVDVVGKNDLAVGRGGTEGQDALVRHEILRAGRERIGAAPDERPIRAQSDVQRAALGGEATVAKPLHGVARRAQGAAETRRCSARRRRGDLWKGCR